MKILETERTILREVVETDAPFILDLLNQPSFIRYIGDRGVRTVEDAARYIEERFTKSYREHGFGLYAVELKQPSQGVSGAQTIASESASRASGSDSGTPIGLCGFVKRDELPDADIGFAFLPQFCGQGLAFEAADAVMEYGRGVLNLERVLAITTMDNDSSGRLLGKIGLQFERLIMLSHSADELKLFSIDFRARP